MHLEVVSLVLKVVYYLQNVPTENSCSIPPTSSLILVSGFRGRFPVNGTDLNPESKTVLDYSTRGESVILTGPQHASLMSLNYYSI